MEWKAKLTRRIVFQPPKEANMTPEEVTQMVAEMLSRVKSVDRQNTDNGRVYVFKDKDDKLISEIHESKPIHPLWRKAIKKVDAKIEKIKNGL